MRPSCSREDEVELESPAANSGSLEGGVAATFRGAPRSPLLTQPRTAASHNPEFSAQPPRVLDVVLVDDLHDALPDPGTPQQCVGRLNRLELLKALANTSEYIKKVNTSETPCACLLYTSPSPRDATLSRMPSSA